MDIIGKKYIFLSLSGLLVLASILAVAVWGLKFGIDFTGGSLLEVEFGSSRPGAEAVRQAMAPLGLRAFSVQSTGERGIIFRFAHIDENTHQEVLARLAKIQPLATDSQPSILEKRFDAIGPVVGRELKRKSLAALALALAAIVLYIAWAFRAVSRPVASWKYGVAAVIALFHDIVIPTGVFAALGNFRGVEVNTLFITALLTIMGFSVHDTIVVFDRIRENLRKIGAGKPYDVIVNQSVNETVVRSVNTSLTVLLVLSAIFLLGGESVRYFSLALMIGIIFGTYSSIFVASPLLVWWQQIGGNKK